MSLKTPTGRLARWALRLQSFDLEIHYTPGRCNAVTDLLSRVPEPDDAQPDGTPAENVQNVDVCSVSIDLPRRSAEETRTEQLKDSSLCEIINAFEESAESDDYLRHTARGYIMSGGVLYR